MRGLLQRWTKSSIILTSKEESVWRNKRPRSRTVSFAEDRLLTLIYEYLRVTQEPTILSRTMPTCSLSILRNDDIQEFDSKWGRMSSTSKARERAACRMEWPVVRLLHKAAQKWHFARFLYVVRSFTANSSLLQSTGVWTAHLTRHIFKCCTTDDTHTRGSSRKFGVRTSHSMSHLHALMLCVWFSSTSPLSFLCCLSSLVSSCFFLLAINFIFHDVVDKFPVNFC